MLHIKIMHTDIKYTSPPTFIWLRYGMIPTWFGDMFSAAFRELSGRKLKDRFIY